MNKPPIGHKFYVYNYIDTRPGHENEVIYVGKGTYSNRAGLRRMELHWKQPELKNKLFFNILEKIRALDLEPIRKVVSWHIEEEDAFAAEIAGISQHRLRMHGGTLCNLTTGGEGASGHIVTSEARAAVAASSKTMWQQPGFREKWVADARARMADPEFKAFMSEASKRLWNDPEHRAKMTGEAVTAAKSVSSKAAWESEDYRTRRIAAQKATFATPEGQAKKSAEAVRRWADDEFKAKTSKAIKDAKSTDEARAKVSEMNKKIWADPNMKAAFSARMKEVLNNPEEKARKAAATKAKWADPEFRAKVAASQAARRAKKTEEPPET